MSRSTASLSDGGVDEMSSLRAASQTPMGAEAEAEEAPAEEGWEESSSASRFDLSFLRWQKRRGTQFSYYIQSCNCSFAYR